MRYSSILSFVLIILSAACVDRFTFDIGVGDKTLLVIYGFISDEPGPYQIEINKAFDIESENWGPIPISARVVTLSDNLGNTEVLSELREGLYITDSSASGIHGVVGRSYSLRVELETGQVYESIPDTLRASGTMDSVYYNYTAVQNSSNFQTDYGFDIFFNSSSGLASNKYLLWNFTGTYQVETEPKLHRKQCPGGSDGCPDPLTCSGFTYDETGLASIRPLVPCTCCICWVNVYNNAPLISEDQVVLNGVFRNIKASRVSLTPYNFMYKMRIEIQQMSLSSLAYSFWKGIRDQKRATNSIFQPVNGKIKSNFNQTSGSPSDVGGLFYAAGISSKAIYIRRTDIPNERNIPQIEMRVFPGKTILGSCLDFPHSTTQKPSYWVD